MNDASRALREIWEKAVESAGGAVWSNDPASVAGWEAIARHAAEQTAGLRAALKTEHHAAVMYRLLPDIAQDWLREHKGNPCEICALLADPEGQR